MHRAPDPTPAEPAVTGTRCCEHKKCPGGSLCCCSDDSRLPFLEAARAEAARRWPNTGPAPTTAPLALAWHDSSMASGFVLGAQWARSNTAVTDEMVERGLAGVAPMSDLRAMLGDRHDQTIEAACYQIAYSTDDPGNDDRCSKPWHSTRCYGHDSDYPPAAAHRFCSFAVARAELMLRAVLPDLLAQAWDEALIAATETGYLPGIIRKDLGNPYRKEN